MLSDEGLNYRYRRCVSERRQQRKHRLNFFSVCGTAEQNDCYRIQQLGDLKSNHATEGRSTHNVISADIIFLDDPPGHVCVRFLPAIFRPVEKIDFES